MREQDIIKQFQASGKSFNEFFEENQDLRFMIQITQ